ncbi:VanZ family protein [Candidatus Pacearchaeota archaeon]|nr:VanZ family protein [Candidatus Pacearchaeota archaeon]
MNELRIFSIIITIILAVIIFYVSSLSMPPSQETGIDLSIPYHILIFFYFSFFLFIASSSSKPKLKYFILTLIIALLYAASDEFHQLFVLNRTCSFSDFLIDSLGILASSLLFLKRKKK